MQHNQPDRARTARTVAAGMVPAALVLTMAAACTSGHSSAGGSSAAGRSAGSPSVVAYSACMRSHGVPNYPDPDTAGRLPKTSAQQLGVGASPYLAAQRACRRLLPTGGSFVPDFQQCVTCERAAGGPVPVLMG